MRNVSPDSEDVKEGGKSKPGDKGKKKETVEEEKKDEEKPTDGKILQYLIELVWDYILYKPA